MSTNATTKINRIVVFTKNNCPQCATTIKRLNKRDIRYHEINIDNDSHRYPEYSNKTAYQYITEDLQMRQAPVVEITDEHGDTHVWAGYRPDNIERIQRYFFGPHDSKGVLVFTAADKQALHTTERIQL